MQALSCVGLAGTPDLQDSFTHWRLAGCFVSCSAGCPRRDDTVPVAVPDRSSPWLPTASMSFVQPHAELGWGTTGLNPSRFPVAGIQLSSFRMPAPLCGHMSDGTGTRGKVAVGRKERVKPLILVQHRLPLCCPYSRPCMLPAALWVCLCGSTSDYTLPEAHHSSGVVGTASEFQSGLQWIQALFCKK